METIHFKSVDPLSQELLREAARMGLDLNWERREKQQPQDGFLRLGLSCPYGCMQGPCRIDPYGRGAEKGICGLDREGMAAAFLLRLALQGALEAMHSCPSSQRLDAEVAFPAPLDKKANAALAKLGGATLTTKELFESAFMLTRPSASPKDLVRQSVRLGLLAVGLTEQHRGQKKIQGSMACFTGYGLLAGDAIIIGLTGQVSEAMVLALSKEIAVQKNKEVRLVTLGDWIPGENGYIPIVCTSGEAETILSSGKLNLILAGPKADPGIVDTGKKLNIPVLFSAEKLEAAAILKQARTAHDNKVPLSFAPDDSLIGEGTANIGVAEVEALFKAIPQTKISLIGGADALQQSLGHLSVELSKALAGQDHAIASWGDSALWMLKQDLSVGILDAQDGPVSAVRALAASGKLPNLTGICFTGLKSCQEFTIALGLAGLGLKVSVAVPLPLWGSEKVRSILSESLAAVNGSLAHYDHPVAADELLDWFLQ
jgi:hypothetical protein